MLSESRVGYIKGLFASGMSVFEIMRKTKHVRQTIVDALDRKDGKKRKGRVLPHIELRRKLVKKLAGQRRFVNGRELPMNPSIQCVQMAMVRHGYTVSRGTVHSDLVATSDVRVRPLTPFEGTASYEARQALKIAHGRTRARRFVFSDEHFITTNDHTTRTMWVPKAKQGQPKAKAIPRVRKSRFNVPSVMIWASIGYNLKGPLVFIDKRKTEEGKTLGMNADRYIRICLSKLVPLLRDDQIFMQDGARPHVSKKTMQYLERKGVKVLENWPAYSPDLNPIENIWHYLDKQIAEHVPRTLADLKRTASYEWAKMPQSMINDYVLSFKKRLEAL